MAWPLYEEKLSGAQRNRPELARLFDQVRNDDVLVVDRLTRSTCDLLASLSGSAAPARAYAATPNPGPTP